MANVRRPGIDRRSLVRGSLVGLQWLALTVGLGAVIVRSERTFEGLIDGRIDSSWAFIAAFGFGLLLGLSIASIRVLIPAVLLMCLGAVGLFVMTLLVPTWDGTVLSTRALRNFIIDRSSVLAIVLLFPAMIGALGGYFLGGLLGASGQVYPPEQDKPDADPAGSWWDRRGRPGD